MANKGWVKLYRKFLDSKEWTGSTSAQREVFIVLLLLAAHEPHKMYIGQEEVVLQPGQVFISVEGICKYIGRLSTRQKTRGAIDKFCKSGFLTKESTSYGMLITIVNWDKYQSSGDYGNQVDNPCTTMGQPPHNQVVNHKQEDIKNDKECKNNIVRFAAPTLDEVKAYCDERHNNIDPQRFIDFYESKGWMVGKNKMKSWKAAVRTWERYEGQSSSPGPAQKSNYDSRSYDDDFLNSLYKNGG